MNTNQTNSTMKEIEYDPLLQGETKQTTLLQTFVRIYQRLSAWTVLTIFWLCGPFFVFLCIVPSLRIFALIYAMWMYYDRRTPYIGGRRKLWATKGNIWRRHASYFPIKLIKTAQVPPDTTYLFATFPHGIWPFGTITNFLSTFTGFDKAFPGLTPHLHTLNFMFNIPFLREYWLFGGVCAVSKESILHVLNGPPGNVSILLVGGYQEALRSSPGTNRIVLKNRKGFVKLALKAGSSLVPVYNFGEPDVYDQYKWIIELQKKKKFTYRNGLFPIGKGPCRVDYLFGILPHQRPITTVVGSPIKLPKVEDPPDQLVNKFYEIFVQELTALFEKYKGKYDSRGEEATLSIE